MSIDIKIKDKLNFTGIDLTAPETVVEECVKEISNATNEMVVCAIKPYDKPIESYNVPALGGIHIITQDTKHDIQKDLGPQGYKTTRFEVFYTSTKLPHYRFRVFFFEYGIGGYPVKVVIEESIARAINKDYYIYKLNNRADLETLIERILTSSKSIEILQDLINATIIANSRETDQVSDCIDDNT